MSGLIKRRIKAFLIDIAILGVLDVFILVIFITNTTMNFLCIHGLAAIIIYILFFCKDVFNGQSIGKRIFKLQVVTEKGKTVNVQNRIARNMIALLQPIDALYMINNNGKRLGDIICRTNVICVE